MCCDNKLGQKEFRRKAGIDILRRNLNYQSVLDQIGNQKIFILVALDCLWNAIIGNKRNEEQFIEMDGLYTLFELLEQSDNTHVKIILSCLASLVDNKRSFSYFIQWKSDNNSNLDTTKLLINIYRQEDKKYGVEFQNGKLTESDRPINPKTSYKIRKAEQKNKEELEKKKLKMSRRDKSEESFLNKTSSDKENNSIKSMGTSTKSTAVTKENIYRSEDFVQSYLNNKIGEITKTFDLRETVIIS